MSYDAARLEVLGVVRYQGFGARQVAALDRLLILRQRRRRRLIIRGWRRVGGNRDDQRQSNHRLFDTSHPYSPFLCAGGIRPPRCFDQIFTSRSRSELAITLTDESAIAAAAMIDRKNTRLNSSH